MLRPVLNKQMKGMRMMKGKNFYTILLCAALMVAGTAACSDDWLSGADTSHDSSEEGQVATVKLEGNGEVVSRSAFQAGTAYRLVMFTKGFEATDTSKPVLTTDSVLRYNGSATETPLGMGTFQYLVVNDKTHNNNDWFGFKSLVADETGRRSISFYGFTYGEEDAPELDADAYTRTEEVNENGELKDLMWGILVDQNDDTAKFPCEIPFRHAFSQLEFKVSQLESETGSGKGMYNLSIESIAVTGTYQIGTVDLFTGKTTLNAENKYGKEGRALPKMSVNYDLEKDEYIAVKKPDSLGAMIVFPSAAKSLSGDVGEYTIGLKITLKGKDKTEVEKLVGTGNATPSSSDDYYIGDYIVEQVYSSVYGGDNPTDDNGSIAASPLYLQAGSKYTLHIVLMEDEVRVVTVVPSKVEWLPGETEKDENDVDQPFSTEVVGQPVFFDNTMWMDRNLGANEADPGGNYNQTIGYYYQNNRNIPYWPYSTERFGYSYYPNQLNSIPKPENRYLDTFTFSSWENPSFKVYPMIDENIMKGDSYKYYWNSNASKLFYKLPSATENPNAKSYIFYWGKGSADVPLDWTTNNSWTKRENQPAPPGYALPTQEQFQSVFPTTVFAGNITFCKLNKSDSDWYGDQTMTEDIIRICVPFYTDGVNTTNKLKYLQLWKNLKDPGASPNRNSYYNGWYDPHFYINSEPDGDPSPGYCSVYIISRKGDDLYTLSIADDIEKYYQTLQWGTIYGIKKVGTSEAYRMRWKVMNAQTISGGIPLLYVKVSMYSCTKNDNLTADNYDSYDWDHPSSEMFFPLCGEVEGRNATQSRVSGFSSYGSAVLYACASNNAALHIKITGSNKANQYMSVVSNEVQTNAKQIRLVKTQN